MDAHISCLLFDDIVDDDDFQEIADLEGEVEVDQHTMSKEAWRCQHEAGCRASTYWCSEPAGDEHQGVDVLELKDIKKLVDDIVASRWFTDDQDVVDTRQDGRLNNNIDTPVAFEFAKVAHLRWYEDVVEMVCP